MCDPTSKVRLQKIFKHYGKETEKINVESYIEELEKTFHPDDPKCRKMNAKLKNLLSKLEIAKDLKTEQEEEEFLLYITELGQAFGALNSLFRQVIDEIDEELHKSQLLLLKTEKYCISELNNEE